MTLQTFAALQHRPDHAGHRLVLFGVRQMGAHGLDDADAAQAFVTAFGDDHRRPLLFLRALLLELSSVAARPIAIAPWCCPRMTPSEGALLAILARALDRPAAAHLLLSDLLGKREVGGALTAAGAVASAFADLGLPLD